MFRLGESKRKKGSATRTICRVEKKKRRSDRKRVEEMRGKPAVRQRVRSDDWQNSRKESEKSVVTKGRWREEKERE